MKKTDLCAAFCEPLDLHEVPIGFAIRTPFRRSDGDAVGVYARRNPSALSEYRLEDDGTTVPYLEALGADLESETRFEMLAGLMTEHEAYYDEQESLFHTGFVPESEIPALAVKFTAFILRVCDLAFTSTTRVRSTFREDLLRLVEAQFGNAADITTNASLRPSMKDYLVDIIVSAKDGRSLAIYAATSELKALEALLFARELRDHHLSDVRTMLVLETSKPREIKERTLSRVMNSEIVLASMDGEELAIRQKMARSLEFQ